MTDSGQRSVYIGHRRHVGTFRPFDHSDGNAELSCRFDLSVGGIAARVLGDHDLNAVVVQHGDLVIQYKRSTCRYVANVRQLEWRLDRIDTADQVGVLRCHFEWQKLLSPQRKEYVSGGSAKCGDRVMRRHHPLPSIALLLSPRRAVERNQRSISQQGGFCSVTRNTRRKGVGRVHQNIEFLVSDEFCKSGRSAKTAGSGWYRLFNRVSCASSHGQQNAEAGVLGQLSGEKAGVRCAAKDQDGACHGL